MNTDRTMASKFNNKGAIRGQKSARRVPLGSIKGCEKIVFEKKHSKKVVQKTIGESIQPEESSPLIKELSLMAGDKREAEIKVKVLEIENTTLKTEIKSTRKKIEKDRPQKFNAQDKQENTTGREQTQLTGSSDIPPKIEEHIKADEMIVDKLGNEAEKLKKEVASEKLKKENPINKEKMIGGVEGFLKTAVEQITGTGKYADQIK